MFGKSGQLIMEDSSTICDLRSKQDWKLRLFFKSPTLGCWLAFYSSKEWLLWYASSWWGVISEVFIKESISFVFAIDHEIGVCLFQSLHYYSWALRFSALNSNAGLYFVDQQIWGSSSSFLTSFIERGILPGLGCVEAWSLKCSGLQ